MKRGGWWIAAGWALLTSAWGADGEDAAWTFRVRAALKGSNAALWYPDVPAIYPSRASADSLWRGRVEPEWQAAPWCQVSAAYEQRVVPVPVSAAAPSGTGVWPSAPAVPYRWTSGEGLLVSPTGYEWRHGVDRLQAVFRGNGHAVTVGRQAIGWGRGMFFSAVDLFAPFLPLAADREWRAGVDAVRWDVRLDERASMDLVATAAGSGGEAVYAVRLRGIQDDVDMEFMGGRRGSDLFLGTTQSVMVGGAEVHWEVAGFVTDQALADGGLFGDDRLTFKAVLGGSYQFALGDGLSAAAEYHYSGFGVREPLDRLVRLAQPAFLSRWLRGDTQLLGRHALVVSCAYPVRVDLQASIQWVGDPSDGSGLLSPSVAWSMTDHVSVQAGFQHPYGAKPDGSGFRSQFGGAPWTAYLQIGVYAQRWWGGRLPPAPGK